MLGICLGRLQSNIVWCLEPSWCYSLCGASIIHELTILGLASYLEPSLEQYLTMSLRPCSVRSFVSQQAAPIGVSDPKAQLPETGHSREREKKIRKWIKKKRYRRKDREIKYEEIMRRKGRRRRKEWKDWLLTTESMLAFASTVFWFRVPRDTFRSTIVKMTLHVLSYTLLTFKALP
jgi:hypothetical protein